MKKKYFNNQQKDVHTTLYLCKHTILSLHLIKIEALDNHRKVSKESLLSPYIQKNSKRWAWIVSHENGIIISNSFATK